MKSNFFQNILKLLRAHARIGALEISDAALRFAYLDGGKWELFAERLLPGTLLGGKIANRVEFAKRLEALKAQLVNFSAPHKKIHTVAVLSSTNIYSQVFNLPFIEGENLEKAIELNLQVVSPGDAKENYASWQAVGDDKKTGHLEILSAFAKRELLDPLQEILEEAGFLPVVIEFKALALARLLREQGGGFDKDKAYLLIYIDSTGLDFLVIRHGALYFEYFNAWADIQGEEKEITVSVFQSVLIRSLHQVLNFYGQHWPDQTAEILVSAGELGLETIKTVRENFSLEARELTLKNRDATSADWLIVLGSGLRGLVARPKDREINFLGTYAEERFRREHLGHFLGFWRMLYPIALGILILSFVGADIFLRRTNDDLQKNSAFNLSGEEAQIVSELEGRVGGFNRLVALIRGARSETTSESPILKKLQEGLQAHRIILTRLQLKNPGNPLLLNGEADSETQIRDFKQWMELEGGFINVNLPLAEIKRTADQRLSFSISFSVNSENTD